MPLPPHIQAYLDSDEFKREKEKFDAISRRVDELSAPIVAGARWKLLEFTEEAMKIQVGDPEIAFQCEWDDWVIRTDFSSEIGNCSWFWKRGAEEEAVREWGDTEFFAHGTPIRDATPDEMEEHGWHMKQAIRAFVYDVLLDV